MVERVGVWVGNWDMGEAMARVEMVVIGLS